MDRRTINRGVGSGVRGAILVEYVILTILIAIATIPAVYQYGLRMKCYYCVNAYIVGNAGITSESDVDPLVQNCVDAGGVYPGCE